MFKRERKRVTSANLENTMDTIKDDLLVEQGEIIDKIEELKNALELANKHLETNKKWLAKIGA